MEDMNISKLKSIIEEMGYDQSDLDDIEILAACTGGPCVSCNGTCNNCNGMCSKCVSGT